jgi:NitT/TauT family transport system permease protein
VVAPSRPSPGAVLTAAAGPPAPPAGGERPSLPGRLLPPLALAAAVVLLWEVGARRRPDSELPSPFTVAAETWRLLVHGDLLAIVLRTTSTMAVGFGVSAVVGLGLGLLLARRSLADRAASPYLIGLQSLPSAVWIPVAVIFLGASSQAVLAVTILGALPSIAIGTRDAVHAIPPLLLRAARTLGAERRTMLLRVVVPAALPGIVSGLEHGWAFAFRSLVAGELIIGASGAGLGFFVATSRDEGRVDHLFAAVLVIMVVGVLVDRLGFARVQRRLRARRGLAAS